MAHNHGSEYQVRIVHGDGTEELSGWLSSAEQVAQAIAADRKPQGKAYWIRAFSAQTARQTRNGALWNAPLRIPTPRGTAHTTPVIW